MLVVLIALFRAALQPVRAHQLQDKVLIAKLSAALQRCMQSRDLSRDQLKRLHDQRKANILSNSPLLEDCRSFDAGLWLLHEK